MATIAETYRNQMRNPRYTSKMQTMFSGMYLTKQIIPEGYAKVMVNYDIDDTGSYIRPRRGRLLEQTLRYDNALLGAVTRSDYIYAYRHDEQEVESIEDMVLSGGQYGDPNVLLGNPNKATSDPVYLALAKKVIDSTEYIATDDGWEPTEPEAGKVVEQTLDSFWALRYNKDLNTFEKVKNKDLGYIKARTVEQAYAFDKKAVGPIGRPVATVLENELYAFTGAPVTFKDYTMNSERSVVENLGIAELTKIQLVHGEDAVDSYYIKRVPVKPYEVRPSLAMSAGFNLLQSQPFVFDDEIGGSLFAESGLPYESQDSEIPNLFPDLGKSMWYRIHYQYPEEGRVLQYKVELITGENADTDQVLQDFADDVTFEAGTPLWIQHTFHAAGGALKVTLRDKEKGSTTDTACIIMNGYSYNQDNNNAMLDIRPFNLSTAKGMITWGSHIGLYGVDSAENAIFFSSAGNPGYFPFPGNYMAFDNEILAVHNYLDHLLVITVDSVYIVTMGATIQQSIKRKLLENIHIPEIDAINVTMFRDEIFFKTDTEFYVLKPNKYTADATDLKNYSNSTALINFTTNFTEETLNILNAVYKPVWQEQTKLNRKQIRFIDFNVLDIKSVSRDAEIHYIYTIKPILTDNVIELDEINLHIIYNTMTRSWRMYTVAVGNEDVKHSPIVYKNKQSGAYQEFFPYKTATGFNVAVVRKTYSVVTDNFELAGQNLSDYFDNYPYVDTGNIALDDAFTKRFREVQFNLVNMEKDFIRFYTDFKVDGLEKVSATNYNIEHITDINDPDYGLIYVTPMEATNLDLPGLTTLSNQDECDKMILEDSVSNLWNLDMSKFPDLDVATIRFELQGRGRRGSIQLLNTSLRRYELSNLTWVYRIMNAR